MSKYLTTNSLIKSVTRRAMIPSTNSTFREEDYLEFANEEMDLGVVPHVLSFHEDYFLQSFLVPLLAGITRYEIPHRAMGNKLREVRIKDENNNIYEMTRIGVGDEPSFQFNTVGFGSVTLRTFSVQGSEIVLNATPDAIPPSGYLEFFVYMRPNEIVSESRTTTIRSIDTNLNTITLNSMPSVFDNVTVFDITSSKNPHKLVAIDVTATVDLSGAYPVLTLPSVDKMFIGDVVALSEETTIPQVPQEIHAILAQRVAIKCLEALGDIQGMQSAMAKLQEMELKSGSILDSRVEDAPMKVNNFHSFLRNSRKWTRR